MTGLDPIIFNGLQTSLAVGVLFTLVLLVRRPFARQFGAKAAYALWLVPLARLFMPPVPAGLSIFGFLAPTQPAAPITPTVGHTPGMIFVPAPHPVSAVPATAPPGPTGPETLSSPADPALLETMLAALPGLLVPIWMVGACLILAIAWRKQTIFHQLIRDDSQPASGEIETAAREIARQLKLKRFFEVRTSFLYGSPLVTGLTRRVVLLPAWFETDYTPREQRDALTHELMHLKRNDLFALQLAQLVLALQWFNPLSHLAMRAFRVDQEAACDADVLRAGTSSAFSYGQTLVKAARLAGPADGAFRGANLTLTHPIKERLILMQNTAPTLRRRLLGSSLALTLGSAAVIATASCAASASPKPEASSNELVGGEASTSTEERTTHVYRFSSHNSDEDRQLVILSDPFDTLQPRMTKLGELDLSDLEAEMKVLTLELDELSELQSLGTLADLEALDILADLDLSGLGDLDIDVDVSDLTGMEFDTVETDEGVKVLISRSGDGAATINIAGIEAIVEASTERVEAITEMQEKRTEAIALRIEKQVEGRAERMEAIGELMGERIEAAFEGNLEHEIEAAAEVVEDLSDQCEERETSQTGPVIVSARGDDGETYRALCVVGSQARLRDDDITAYVLNNDELSNDEKARFEQKRSYTYEYSWNDD
jgi:beta-lactamase regulating signal transducer with metallopeptidase domain